MKAQDCKLKAEQLLAELKGINYDKWRDFSSDDNSKKYWKIVDDFLHLVFFFNPEMPLYKEMIDVRVGEHSNNLKKEPEYYMQRFIELIDKYAIDE